jgi:hypothetical protein
MTFRLEQNGLEPIRPLEIEKLGWGAQIHKELQCDFTTRLADSTPLALKRNCTEKLLRGPPGSSRRPTLLMRKCGIGLTNRCEAE